MKDKYEMFGDIYELECNMRGYVESGFILYREKISDVWHYDTVRIEYYGDDDRFVFEDDFYEGQECYYIKSMTDTEIRKYMESTLI